MSVKRKSQTTTAGIDVHKRPKLDSVSPADAVLPVPAPTADTADNAHGDSPTELKTVKIEGFSDHMQERFRSMRRFADHAHGYYYVTQFPDTLRFGHDQAFDMSNFVVRSDNVAAQVWLLGRVTALKFHNDDGTPADQVYVSVIPLWKEDTRDATKITNFYSAPRQFADLNPFGSVIANRFQKMYNSDKPAKEYTALYDATMGMKSRKDMNKVPPSKLKKGDVVLLQMKVKKRFEKKDMELPKEKRPHTINFQLESVCLIHESREPNDEEEEIAYDF